MKNLTPLTLLVIMALGMVAGSVSAESSVYRFEAVEPTIKVGETSEMDVRLTEAATGKPITNASITAIRLDMGPDNMASMAAPVKQTSSPQPGIYHFVGNVMAQGQWALRLTANVPGEKEAISGVVVFKAAQ